MKNWYTLLLFLTLAVQLNAQKQRKPGLKVIQCETNVPVRIKCSDGLDTLKFVTKSGGYIILNPGSMNCEGQTDLDITLREYLTTRDLVESQISTKAGTASLQLGGVLCVELSTAGTNAKVTILPDGLMEIHLPAPNIPDIKPFFATNPKDPLELSGLSWRTIQEKNVVFDPKDRMFVFKMTDMPVCVNMSKPNKSEIIFKINNIADFKTKPYAVTPEGLVALAHPLYAKNPPKEFKDFYAINHDGLDSLRAADVIIEEDTFRFTIQNKKPKLKETAVKGKKYMKVVKPKISFVLHKKEDQD